MRPNIGLKLAVMRALAKVNPQQLLARAEEPHNTEGAGHPRTAEWIRPCKGKEARKEAKARRQRGCWLGRHAGKGWKKSHRARKRGA